jgi:hypothetical protein
MTASQRLSISAAVTPSFAAVFKSASDPCPDEQTDGIIGGGKDVGASTCAGEFVNLDGSNGGIHRFA